MSVEQFVAILGAFTAMIVALGVCIQQVRSTRTAVDGRMTELLALTRTNARLEVREDLKVHPEFVDADDVVPASPPSSAKRTRGAPDAKR